MVPTSIGDAAGGFVAAEQFQNLTHALGKELGPHPRVSSDAIAAPAAQSVTAGGKPIEDIPSGPQPITDVASVLLSEVATSDMTRLTRILDPSSDPDSNRMLDSLLHMAVQEVQNGNAERAVGYLADYATRDPRRGEALPLEPALEQVRDKIDSMVNRMTVVAKMSAENGLSRAEQSSSEMAGKLHDWDTNADVLLKLAHRLFEAGGYANYSRTAELARALNDASADVKPAVHALAATASASSAPAMPAPPAANQAIPGINVPYWVSPDFPFDGRPGARKPKSTDPASAAAMDDIRQNLRDLKTISWAAFRQLWQRAPLLVMMMIWFAIGLTGGLAFAITNELFPDTQLMAAGNLAFSLWGIGFLALVGFGFYVRIRYRPLR